MSDTPEQDTLEQQVERWADSKYTTRAEGVADLRRFLQLARREGFARRDHMCYHGSRPADLRAAAEFPLPPVTRTVTRIEPDPHGDGEWLVRHSTLYWRAETECPEFMASNWLRTREPTFTPERCLLWADLLKNPLKTETVEDE